METMIRRELAKPSPRSRLIPIIKVIEAVARLSGGRASIPEICDVLTRCFDADKMMIYRGLGYGLAEPIDGFAFDEHSGLNERREITCELFNSCYWKNPDAIIFTYGEPLNAGDFLMARSDGQTLAQRLWDALLNFDPNKSEPFPSNAYANWSDSHSSTIPASETQDSDTAQTPVPAKENAPSGVSRWPWGQHHTVFLGHLEAAAQRFWVNYDPSEPTTAPTNSVVSEWLKTERKVSRTMADSIASMLRPDGLPTGPRK